MATTGEVQAAGLEARDRLQARIDDPDFSVEDRERLATEHALLSRRLSAFVAAPGHGPSSTAYEAPLAAARTAVRSLDGCSATSPRSVLEALAACRRTSQALAGATAVIGAGRALSGSLSIRRSRPGAGAAGREAKRQGGEGDATEPYLTSLAKLFPAEALSALLLVLAIDARFATVRHILVGVILVSCGALRWFASRDPQTGRPDLLAVIVAMVSFLIYAAAMMAFGVLFGTDESTTRIVATVMAILWMAGLTAVVRKPRS